MGLFQKYADTVFFGNAVGDYLAALAALLVAYLALRLLFYVLHGYLSKFAEKSRTRLDDLAIAIAKGVELPLFLLVFVLLIRDTLEFPEAFNAWAKGITAILTVIIIIQVLGAWVSFLFQRISEKKDRGSQSLQLLGMVIRIAIWTIGAVFLISFFGYDVTSLVAGLGIGGIAIALAVQNILGDLFSSLSIFIDKPFREGDFIVAGDKMGTVSKIGLKTTRLISMAGEELVIPNQSISGRDIQNFGRVQKRRGVINLGVTYDTPLRKMEKIPNLVRNIVGSKDGVEFDRGHFKSFGPYSKDFEFVFYVETKDYKEFLDHQQDILLGIERAFEKERISFAFPTQTLHLKK